MRLIILFCAIGITLNSCTISQSIPDKTVYFKYDAASGSDYIEKYETTSKEKVTISEDRSIVKINFNEKQDSIVKAYPSSVNYTDNRAEYGTHFTHDYDSIQDIGYNSFNYNELKISFTSFTVPLKVRPKVESLALLDSFPKTIENSFSISFAPGIRYSWNYFTPDNPYNGTYFTRISITGGLMAGIGSVELSKDNTRDPITIFKHKTFIYSTGFYGLIGLNNLQLGLSYGWDFATGAGSKGWVYQGQDWWGFVLGVDILK